MDLSKTDPDLHTSNSKPALVGGCVRCADILLSCSAEKPPRRMRFLAFPMQDSPFLLSRYLCHTKAASDLQDIPSGQSHVTGMQKLQTEKAPANGSELGEV